MHAFFVAAGPMRRRHLALNPVTIKGQNEFGVKKALLYSRK